MPLPTYEQHSCAAQRQEEAIRLIAYLKWVADRYPPSDGVPYWLEAEKEYKNMGVKRCCRETTNTERLAS